ncbi:unnamed protein product [Closterium sp. NIES-65]|nr:unnamed protein product [Closterium sp. NIES-65]
MFETSCVRGEGRLERSATAGAALIDSPLTLFVPHDTCDHACVQVCEERDALEDLLLQEQLKNGTPAVSPSSCHPTTYTSFRFDKQVEEARAQAAALEMELQAMASRCDEWKRRAGERAAEMNPVLVQALLEERLEELDDSGVLALQVECARLRDELAKSEVLRFELYRSLEQGAVEVESRWESEASGMSPAREGSFKSRDAERHSNDSDEDAPGRATTPVMMECDESVVQELLELGQASLTQEDVTRLMETVEAAERRAEKAEREAEQRAVQVQLLEAKMAAMLNSCPMDEHKRSPSLVSSSPISFRLSPVASSSSPDPASLTRSSSSSATSQHSQQQQQQALFQEQQAGRQNQDEREQSPQLSGRGDRVAGVEGELNGAALGSKFTGRGTAEGGVVAAARKGGDLTHEAVVRRGALGVVVDRNPRTKPEEEQEQLEVEEREEEGEDGVEELRQMVHRVQRQNRITHVLLSVVIAVSIPPLVALVRGWFGGWGRRYEPKRPGAGPAPKQVARVAIRSK